MQGKVIILFLMLMKQRLITLFGLMLLGFSAFAYEIKVESNSRQGMAYLTYYFGNNLHVEDSAVVGPQGNMVFKNAKELPGGIYALVFPGRSKILEFLVDKPQEILIKADTSQLENAVVTGSPENKLFESYQRFVQAKGAQLSAEREAFMKATNRADSVKHEANFRKHNKELNDYRQKIITDHPNSMMASILNAMKDADVDMSAAKTRQDSIRLFDEYRRHYWDNTNFLDGRLVRTPFFLPKMERYYRDVIAYQPADTIIKDIDYKLLYSRTSPEMYKFLINWFTDEYINPKIMGQDAVFVHLFEKYHSQGQAPWLNEKQNENISRRAYMLMSNLIGRDAAPLNFLDINDKPVSLHNIKAKYTVLVFWDPDCGHCKEVVPRVDSMYQAKWKKNDVQIFAVLNDEAHIKDWKDFIKEKNLTSWTHAHETEAMAKAIEDAKRPGYRQLYDVTSTPTIYLLDSNKKIIGKKLDWSQIDKVMDNFEKGDK